MGATSIPRNTRNTRKNPAAYVSGFRVFRVFRGRPWPALVPAERGQDFRSSSETICKAARVSPRSCATLRYGGGARRCLWESPLEPSGAALTPVQVVPRSPLQPGKVGTFRRNVLPWASADASAKRRYRASGISSLAVRTRPSRGYLRSTSVVPPFYLRGTSVVPPFQHRTYNRGTTEVLRRYYGGRTEVLRRY
jgi:hypothetical protein